MSTNLRITSTYMICPACMELLLREDVEGFGHCPYCDHAFDLNSAVEDFLLSPVIRQWLHNAHTQIEHENHFPE